jgi:hypothetical protein
MPKKSEPKWLEEDWVEPEPPQPADIHRGMRRLAQAVLLQAATDFQCYDPHLRRSAEQFLYPSPERSEDLRWTIEVSALGSEWMKTRLLRLRDQTPKGRICACCRKDCALSDFYNAQYSCKSCQREQTLRRKAAACGDQLAAAV